MRRATIQVRAAAIIRRGGEVLLQHDPATDFVTLPGGRVEPGETSADALVRELNEELDEQIEVGPLQAIIENFFTWGGARVHEIALWHQAHLPAGSRMLASEELAAQDGSPLVFSWHEPTTSLDPPFEPAPLMDVLRHPTPTTHHIVRRAQPSHAIR